jgi:hypothetical protein
MTPSTATLNLTGPQTATFTIGAGLGAQSGNLVIGSANASPNAAVSLTVQPIPNPAISFTLPAYVWGIVDIGGIVIENTPLFYDPIELVTMTISSNDDTGTVIHPGVTVTNICGAMPGPGCIEFPFNTFWSSGPTA